MRNPYVVLGVLTSATPEEIKKAYRDLCKKWHPDMPGGNREKFEEIQHAYEALTKPGGAEQARSDPFGFQENLRSKWRNANRDDFSDAFRYAFSRWGNSSYYSSWGFDDSLDINCELQLSFEEMCSGCEKVFVISRKVFCKKCAQPCKHCQEKGCPACRFTGKMPSETCSICSGTGMYGRAFRVTLTIRAGVENNWVTELKGMGNEGSRGRVGNVYVRFIVGGHPIFKRKNRLDIHSTESVDVFRALLGGKVTIRTIRGTAEVVLPGCIHSGHQQEIAEAGIEVDGAKGSHYVKFNIKMPKCMTERQRELIQKIMEPEPEGPTVSQYA